MAREGITERQRRIAAAVGRAQHEQVKRLRALLRPAPWDEEAPEEEQMATFARIVFDPQALADLHLEYKRRDHVGAGRVSKRFHADVKEGWRRYQQYVAAAGGPPAEPSGAEAPEEEGAI